MSVINSTQIKPIYTTLIAAKYDELLKIKATSFLRSLFPDNVTKVRYPSYEVRRGSEKVAIDVTRGHQGIRTQLTKATQKIIDSFYYRLYFDATELECYWNLFGSTSISENVMTEFVNGVSVANKANQDMIERAYEVMCAEILEYGTATSFNDGSIVNFHRKSGSFPDAGAGQYWADAGVDPYIQIQDDCEFIRKYGKYMGGTFYTIMGETAYNDFLNNAIVKQRNDLKMWKLDELNAPNMLAEGQTYHGTISCGPYIVHILSYPQFYEHPTTEVLTPYMNPIKIVTIPPKPEFQTIYAATPQLVTPGQGTASLISGKYVMQEAIEVWERKHKFGIESAGLPVPLAIDTIVTRTVAEEA